MKRYLLILLFMSSFVGAMAQVNPKAGFIITLEQASSSLPAKSISPSTSPTVAISPPSHTATSSPPLE